MGNQCMSDGASKVTYGGDLQTISNNCKQNLYSNKPDIDAYSEMCKEAKNPSEVLCAKLLKSIEDAVKDDGKVDFKEFEAMMERYKKEHVIRICGACGNLYLNDADENCRKCGKGANDKDTLLHQGLTSAHRWTIRWALCEFEWDTACRQGIFEFMWNADPMFDKDSKRVDDADDRQKMITGPNKQELAKMSEATVAFDGMLLNKGMIAATKQALDDDGVIDSKEAVQIFKAAMQDDAMDRRERWTLRYLVSAHRWTDAAFHFIIEALSKAEQDEITASKAKKQKC